MAKIALEDSKIIYEFEILSKELVTHDTLRLIFALPSDDHLLGFNSGQHVLFIANIGNKEISRKYTPISLENEKGTFQFVIKVYRNTLKFPNGGIMTKYLESLNVGDFVKMEGPRGNVYKHSGLFYLKYDKDLPFMTKKVKSLGMVAGGSGIAPLFQIAKTICLDANDNTQIKMIYSNHSEDDIILRNELYQLSKEYPNKIKIWYTITNSTRTEKWEYSLGRVNEDMFSTHLPQPTESDCLIMFCGPKAMNITTRSLLEKLNYPNEMIFKY